MRSFLSCAQYVIYFSAIPLILLLANRPNDNGVLGNKIGCKSLGFDMETAGLLDWDAELASATRHRGKHSIAFSSSKMCEERYDNFSLPNISWLKLPTL